MAAWLIAAVTKYLKPGKLAGAFLVGRGQRSSLNTELERTIFVQDTVHLDQSYPCSGGRYRPLEASVLGFTEMYLIEAFDECLCEAGIKWYESPGM
jgi:hypothetical protein